MFCPIERSCLHKCKYSLNSSKYIKVSHKHFFKCKNCNKKLFESVSLPFNLSPSHRPIASQLLRIPTHWNPCTEVVWNKLSENSWPARLSQNLNLWRIARPKVKLSKVRTLYLLRVTYWHPIKRPESLAQRAWLGVTGTRFLLTVVHSRGSL